LVEKVVRYTGDTYATAVDSVGCDKILLTGPVFPVYALSHEGYAYGACDARAETGRGGRLARSSFVIWGGKRGGKTMRAGAMLQTYRIPKLIAMQTPIFSTDIIFTPHRRYHGISTRTKSMAAE